jgi:hypothetical protein
MDQVYVVRHKVLAEGIPVRQVARNSASPATRGAATLRSPSRAGASWPPR